MKKKTFIILILPVLAMAGGYLLREVFATSNPHQWTDGLVGYWSFDGQYTTSTAGTRDVSNNGHWGAFNGGVKPTAGVSGQALSFDGVDDYVNISANSVFNSGAAGEFTYSAWVKAGNYSTKQVILSRRNPCNNDGTFNIFIQSNKIYFNFYSNIDLTVVSHYSNAILTNGQLYHIVWVKKWGQTGVKLYVNGVSQTINGDASTQGSTYNLAIQIGAQVTDSGCNPGTFQNFFNGLIDEVRIYNRALGADEVKQHYDQTRRNLVVNQPSGTPPVGWWKMDEPTGAQVRDYSVNANNGTVSNGGYGATSTDGKIGKALSFDGTDDYVSVPSSSNLITGTSDWTISEWIKPTTNPDVAPMGLQFKTATYENIYLMVGVGSTMRVVVSTPATLLVPDVANAINVGVWQHFVLTKDGNNYKLYKNGVLISSGTQTVNFETPTSNYIIGANQGSFTQLFNGLIDEVRIYNYARTADQIAADYRAGAYRTIVGASVPSTWWTDGLVGYWNFDGPNTTSTAGTRDTSGQNNWGTFNGGVKPTAGISGQALSFDGSDDYVSVGVTSGITSVYSIEAWIKISGSIGNSHTIFGGTTLKYTPDIQVDPTNHPRIVANAADQYLISANALANNTWYHYVAIFNGKYKAIYINGVLDSQETDPTYTATWDTAGHLIGAKASTPETFFNGLIDEVRIYSRALSADEVLEHYQKTRRNLGI